MAPASSSSSDRDRRRRRLDGQNRAGELSLPGDSEHHTSILLELNEEDSRTNTEDVYSPTIMASSLLAMVQCDLSVNRNFGEEFPAM
jgi:hypothetical protein